jgi:hypothetical protein
MTTFREIRSNDVIGDVEYIVGRNKWNVRILSGPLTVLDVRDEFVNWNSGFVEMQIQVKSFDTPAVWVTVLPDTEINVIVSK